MLRMRDFEDHEDAQLLQDYTAVVGLQLQ